MCCSVGQDQQQQRVKHTQSISADYCIEAKAKQTANANPFVCLLLHVCCYRYCTLWTQPPTNQQPQSLPTPGSVPLRELLSSTVSSKQRGLEVSQDWRLVDTSEWGCSVAVEWSGVKKGGMEM